MYNGSVRTTIEMKPEHRAKLLELAAQRGEKGFSSVIGEAIEAYLNLDSRSIAARKKALLLRGTLSRTEAEQLHRQTEKIRISWR